MTFSCKPEEGTNTSVSKISPEKWEVWNNYLDSLVEGDEISDKGKLIKTTSVIGVVNLIVKAGYQKQEDTELDSTAAPPKEGEEHSSEELEVLKKFKNNTFKWVDGKRKVYLPQKPQEEYIVCIDIPDIMVDFGKHPSVEGDYVEDLKPLRISLNGKYKGEVNRHIVIRKDGRGNVVPLKDKHLLYKIAKAGGVLQKFIDSGYDLGVLAGLACKWELEYIKSPGKEGAVFHRIEAKDPSKIEDVKAGKTVITREEQIPDCPIPFTGILLNDEDGYSEDALKMLRVEHIKLLEGCTSFKPSPDKHPDFVLGIDWEDTDLCKALKARTEAYLKNLEDGEGEEETASEGDLGDSSATATDSFEEDGFDDDIPL